MQVKAPTYVQATGKTSIYVCIYRLTTCELYTIIMCLDCDIGQTEEMDLIFVLDDSGNIGPLQFEYLRQFVMQTSLELDIGLQNSLVGAILYDSSPSLEFGVTQNTNETSLLSAITNIPYNGGGCNTSAALDLLRTAGQPGGALNLRDGYTHNAIVVTDGGSTSQILRMLLMHYMQLRFVIRFMLLV